MSILTRITKDMAKNLLPKTLYALDFHIENKLDSKTPVFLTFDDGPHPEFTPKILDVLAENNAKATFFVLGSQIKGASHIIKRAVAEGHSIGTHTWSHWNAKEADLKAWKKDVYNARCSVEDIIGQPCNLFRPPYGDLTPLTLLYLVRNSFQVIQWSLDTKDFRASSKDQLGTWFANTSPKAGDIILMHDNKETTSQGILPACEIWGDKIEFLAIPMM